MRTLTSDEISRASDPRVERYVLAASGLSFFPCHSISHSVHLDAEYVMVDEKSYVSVCTRLGIVPEQKE